MNPSNHCRTSIFEEKFKFQYARGEIHVHIATQNLFLTFLSSGTLPGYVNMEVSPNNWNRNILRTTSLYKLGVHGQFQRRKLSNWIRFTVKLKLKSS